MPKKRCILDDGRQVCFGCKEAKALSDFTGTLPQCKPCMAAKRRKWHWKNRDKSIAVSKAWKERNKEQQKSYLTEYRAKNKESRNANSAAWKLANRARVSEYNRQYLKDNYGAQLARCMARHAQKRKACPKWANRAAIEEFYELAILRTETLGIPHEVDHIVPLISPAVCGLHVEANLRVIPTTDNRRKSNKWWPDMPQSEQRLG